MEYATFTFRIPKQPWKWLRYRISTLLWIVFVVALALSWRHDHMRQQAEIDQLRNPGPRWGTVEVLGPPNTPNYGDKRTAWASASRDDQIEWILAEFDQAVQVTSVHIYETHNPGAVFKITTPLPLGIEKTLWEGTDPTLTSAAGGISKIPITSKQPIRRIKIYLNSPAVPGWNEIDAIGLVEANGKIHWATGAKASSSYGSRRYSKSGAIVFSR